MNYAERIESRYKELLLSLENQGFELPSIQPEFDKLEIYLELLEKWNHVHDLVTKASIDEYINAHFMDSLAALLVYLSSNKESSVTFDRVIDIGSGAGFPGVVWALSGAQIEEMLLVEPRDKRVAFLQEVKSKASLSNVSIAPSRFDSTFTSELPKKKTLSILRALKPSDEIVSCCKAISIENSELLHLAGKEHASEIEAPHERMAYTLFSDKARSISRYVLS